MRLSFQNLLSKIYEVFNRILLFDFKGLASAYPYSLMTLIQLMLGIWLEIPFVRTLALSEETRFLKGCLVCWEIFFTARPAAHIPT